MRDSVLYEFFSVGRKKKYSSGEVIVVGEDPAGIVYVISGFVKVYSISDQGDEYVHIIYQKGDVFPLIWAFRNTRRRVFYEALSETNVWLVPKDKFLVLIRKDLQAANEVIQHLTEHFYVYADRIDNLEYKSTRERIIHRLLFLASRFGKRDGSEIIIRAPITHELIANSIRLSRETVSREMEELTRKKLIARHEGMIIIRDLDRLAEGFSKPVTLDLWGLKPTR